MVTIFLLDQSVWDLKINKFKHKYSNKVKTAITNFQTECANAQNKIDPTNILIKPKPIGTHAKEQYELKEKSYREEEAKFKSILEPKVKIPEYTNLVLPSLFKILVGIADSVSPNASLAISKSDIPGLYFRLKA